MNGKRLCLVLALAALTIVVTSVACAAPPSGADDAAVANYPAQDINFVVGFAPGGSFDITARILAPYMKKLLPKPVNVVIQNISEGGGKAGVNQLMKAKPDGYTIGIFDPLLLAQMQLGGELPTGVTMDKIAFLGRTHRNPQALTVNTKGRFQSVADMKGQKVRFAVTSGMVFYALVVAKEAGIDPILVVSEGGPQAAQNVVRGDADAFVLSLTATLQRHQTYPNELKTIVVSGDQRSKDLPNTPTAAESGLKDTAAIWDTDWAIMAPPGLVAKIQQLLEDAVAKSLADPAAVEELVKAKLAPSPANAADTRKRALDVAKMVEARKDILEQMAGKK